MADIAAAGDGDACLNCGKPLHTSRGVEVGNIFKLGTRYTDALGATYLASDGTQKPIVMGSYGIGVGRLLACVAEEHHDDKGLIWPIEHCAVSRASGRARRQGCGGRREG